MTALGEFLADAVSDTGSIPVISTRKAHNLDCELLLLIRVTFL